MKKTKNSKPYSAIEACQEIHKDIHAKMSRIALNSATKEWWESEEGKEEKRAFMDLRVIASRLNTKTKKVERRKKEVAPDTILNIWGQVKP